MNIPFDTDESPDEDPLGLVGRILIGLIRVAALPIIALGIVLVALIYAVAHASWLASEFASTIPRLASRPWAFRESLDE